MAEASNHPIPRVLKLSDTTIQQPEQTANRNRFARIVTRAQTGSDVMFGASWVLPNETTGVTAFRDDVTENETAYGYRHEVYYVVRGELDVIWEHGVLHARADEAVYLAPGWSYQLHNPGSEETFFVYAMHPPAE
jgi:mannose-6-phosphate isomerase-like protein (cupin superfamily)